MDRSQKPIIANISNRHIHVSEEDLYRLFGAGYKLTNIRDLMQPGQFACKEKLRIVGIKGEFPEVRIIGPIRKQTQIEISRTDGFILGVNPPVRDSGDLANSTPIMVIGPKDKIELKEGCIIAKRHVHFTPQDAERFGVKDKEMLSVRAGLGAGREVIFKDVLCRVRADMSLECHLDTDEANACGLKNGDIVYIL